MSTHISNLPFKHYPRWLNKSSSEKLFNSLVKDIKWKTEKLEIFGRLVKVPRKIAFFGDKNVNYIYSKKTHYALPWIPSLFELKEKIQAKLESTFNSVLCNYYKDGNDYIGWHQDNEKDLGSNPIIASISLGTERKFLIRHSQTKQIKEFILSDGDLFIMFDDCQKNWQHSLPKCPKNHSPRINLTYRKIIF